VVLHGSGALYLPRQETLLVADAHFGKAVSFRKLGVPVPEGTTAGTLQSLDSVLADTGARAIVFLGDFLHSTRSHARETLAALRHWRERHRSVALTLVRGNHDARAGDPPRDLDVLVLEEPLPAGPFALCHHPEPRTGAYVLAGHWHPCVHVRGRAFEHLRLPCFWFRGQVGVLPAFGSFTGMHPIERTAEDRVYAVANDRVREVPAVA
jgi:uncharacterized protein